MRCGRRRMKRGSYIARRAHVNVLAWWRRRVSVTTPNPIVRLQDVIGNRGEKLVELCLTDYATFDAPLFRLSHLGEKWPAVDFYGECPVDRRK
jgi:hypothetical protein